MLDPEVVDAARRLWDVVLVDDTEVAERILGRLNDNDVWWLAEKAERLALLARCASELREG